MFEDQWKHEDPARFTTSVPWYSVDIAVVATVAMSRILSQLDILVVGFLPRSAVASGTFRTYSSPWENITLVTEIGHVVYMLLIC